MNAIIENTKGLTIDEQMAVRAAMNGCRNNETLDDAARNLSALFPDWLVYRGGNHVALHRASGSSRIAIITA